MIALNVTIGNSVAQGREATVGIKRELRSPTFTTYVLLPAKATSRHLNRHRQSNVAATDGKN